MNITARTFQNFGLRLKRRLGIVQLMQQPLRFLFTSVILCLCASLGGCLHVHTRPPTPKKAPIYYKVMASDFEGGRIADYVAEGEVLRADDGYRFSAVERRIYQPEVIEMHYPLGRVVTAKAPNVIVVPTDKPLWLRHLDRDAMALEGKTEIEVDPPTPSGAH